MADTTEDTTEDGPFGRNPYPKDHPKYEDWCAMSRYAKEEISRFFADHLKEPAAESQDWKIYRGWQIKGLVGQLDIKAK